MLGLATHSIPNGEEGDEESKPYKLDWREGLVFSIVYGIALIISLANINLDLFLTFHAVFVITSICFIIPVILNIKCIYFSKNNPPQMEENSRGEEDEGMECRKKERTKCYKGFDIVMMVLVVLMTIFCILKQLDHYLNIFSSPQSAPAEQHLLAQTLR